MMFDLKSNNVQKGSKKFNGFKLSFQKTGYDGLQIRAIKVMEVQKVQKLLQTVSSSDFH